MKHENHSIGYSQIVKLKGKKGKEAKNKMKEMGKVRRKRENSGDLDDNTLEIPAGGIIVRPKVRPC